jgi:HEAT repeat protein
MKTKRLRIALAILIVAMVGGVGWLVLRPGEPVYKGESYSMWLDEYAASAGHLSEAEVAIRHIGTNAIPQLLKLLAAKDSQFEEYVIELARRQTWISIRLPEAWRDTDRAFWGFKVLGADAKPAVPGLVALLDGKDRDVRMCALIALRSIGPSASNAVPAIIQHFNGTDFSTRIMAAQALGTIHAMSGSSVPALTASLQDSNSAVIVYGIGSLEAFGVEAKPAVPALVGLLKDPDLGVRTAATNALKKIDPEAAVKAGVK